MTENDLIELYCIIDNFYQRFIMTTAGKKNLELYYGKRGPSRRMTVPEIMTLNIARILDRIADSFELADANSWGWYDRLEHSGHKSIAGHQVVNFTV